MRILIIGAVAAGTSAAAKARRNDDDSEIVIYEKDSHISYSGCGMPYFIGGEVDRVQELTPRDSKFFWSKYKVEIKIKHEVENVDPMNKVITIRNLDSGQVFQDHYDKLILATGASSLIPDIRGVELEHVFSLRNISDMLKIKNYLEKKKPKSAVILGTGFIGLEMGENLVKAGLEVTFVEKMSQVNPGLDEDMSIYVKDHLIKNGVNVFTESTVTQIQQEQVILQDKTKIKADLVLISVGVRPNTKLAKEMGITLGEQGAIVVNEYMETNITDVYACGDCIQQQHLITNKPVYRPMGSTANKTGRIAGDVVTGGNLTFRGILGTGIFRIFNLTVGTTGLTERQAKLEGYEVEICHNIKPDKPEYMGGKELIIKGIADRTTGKILGVQIIGEHGVDKRIDVFVTAITFGAKAEDLFHLDLAYAPPFSTTKDPVMYTGMILDNAIHRGRKLITGDELDKSQSQEKVQIIDARTMEQYEKNHLKDAVNMPHKTVRDELEGLDPKLLTVSYCNKGVTGNAVQNILINRGFKDVRNLSGGHKHYRKNHPQ